MTSQNCQNTTHNARQCLSLPLSVSISISKYTSKLLDHTTTFTFISPTSVHLYKSMRKCHLHLLPYSNSYNIEQHYDCTLLKSSPGCGCCLGGWTRTDSGKLQSVTGIPRLNYLPRRRRAFVWPISISAYTQNPTLSRRRRRNSSQLFGQTHGPSVGCGMNEKL